jgi:hypothetical protein
MLTAPPSSASIEECQSSVALRDLPGHGQDGRDADAAGDEQVMLRRFELKVVARPPELQQAAGAHSLVDFTESAPAVGIVERGDPILGLSLGSEQRLYCRTAPEGSTTSICAPGVQAGNSLPSVAADGCWRACSGRTVLGGWSSD